MHFSCTVHSLCRKASVACKAVGPALNTMQCFTVPAALRAIAAATMAACALPLQTTNTFCHCCYACSAPEILLAVVESILRLGKPAGELGASTIVGSAAYNILMVAAVCTASLPTGGWVLVDGGVWAAVGVNLEILGEAAVVVARLGSADRASPG